MRSINTKFVIAVAVFAVAFSSLILSQTWLSTKAHLEELTAHLEKRTAEQEKKLEDKEVPIRELKAQIKELEQALKRVSSDERAAELKAALKRNVNKLEELMSEFHQKPKWEFAELQIAIERNRGHLRG